MPLLGGVVHKTEHIPVSINCKNTNPKPLDERSVSPTCCQLLELRGMRNGYRKNIVLTDLLNR